jgi:hypothetical protein
MRPLFCPFREYRRAITELLTIAERNRNQLRLYIRGTIIMFETAVQGKRTGMLWGINFGCTALAELLGAGYVLIA